MICCPEIGSVSIFPVSIKAVKQWHFPLYLICIGRNRFPIFPLRPNTHMIQTITAQNRMDKKLLVPMPSAIPPSAIQSIMNKIQRLSASFPIPKATIPIKARKTNRQNVAAKKNNPGNTHIHPYNPPNTDPRIVLHHRVG